jgi:hypothetical protein
MSSIIALCVISASEIAEIVKDFTYEWVEKYPEEFKQILFQAGMDIRQPIELQENILHRNRMNKTVQCDRWVGNERTDREWVYSGYASKESRDKASGSRLLADIYRMKGLVE